MIFFSPFPTNDTLQWHEDLIFEGVQSAWHIYNKQLASQSAAKTTIEFLRCRWQMNARKLPGPHPLGQTRPRGPVDAPAPVDSLPPWSFLPGQAASGNGSWNWSKDAIVESFYKCKYGNKRFWHIVFTCLYWDIFLVKVLCKLELIVCSPSIWFLVSISFSVSVLSCNMWDSDCWACLQKTCSHRCRELVHKTGSI